MVEPLRDLVAGMPIVFGGDRVVRVSPELADAFTAGDRLIIVQDDGDLLHVPAAVWTDAADAVGRARAAFAGLGSVDDEQISAFFEAFACRLGDNATFGPIAEANRRDVEQARDLGRSITRLVLSDSMRSDMMAGLRLWRDTPSPRGLVVETIDHEGWRVEQRKAGLGVVGFVFEGRPNVFADACGVLRSGNTVVFRIGRDALGTARAIVQEALDPALDEAGLPAGAATLVDRSERSAGWAMFSDPRLSLAVARGSGQAVAQLGAVARQAGTPVSLHGTGGAWIVSGQNADGEAFGAAVEHSLDRKVCNTLNTCVLLADRIGDLLPVFLAALDRAGQTLGTITKLHITDGHQDLLPPQWFEAVDITRAGGPVSEPRTEPIPVEGLGHEWEWEDSPEVTLTVVQTVDEAVDLFNEHSPRFVASLVSDDPAEHRRFFDRIDAPFVGNGFTRWVDGQYAFHRPELGLSNWQFGRLFGRGGVLSGDSVYTLRTRATQTELHLRR